MNLCSDASCAGSPSIGHPDLLCTCSSLIQYAEQPLHVRVYTCNSEVLFLPWFHPKGIEIVHTEIVP